jgi:hypothetical protein
LAIACRVDSAFLRIWGGSGINQFVVKASPIGIDKDITETALLQLEHGINNVGKTGREIRL